MSHSCETSKAGRHNYRIYTRSQDGAGNNLCTLQTGQLDAFHYVRITPLRMKYGTEIQVKSCFPVDPSAVLAFVKTGTTVREGQWEKVGTVSGHPVHFKHYYLVATSPGQETVVVQLWEDDPTNPKQGSWTQVDRGDVEFEVTAR